MATILRSIRMPLVPRPETELIVDYVLDSTFHDDEFNLIDIGTGSGAIAVSIAKNRKKANIFASDIIYYPKFSKKKY